MARGFESKDVEFQQAEKEREKRLGRALTPDERGAAARRQTIELALARARADLAAVGEPISRRRGHRRTSACWPARSPHSSNSSRRCRDAFARAASPRRRLRT